jgi:hypothetical protein
MNGGLDRLFAQIHTIWLPTTSEARVFRVW